MKASDIYGLPKKVWHILSVVVRYFRPTCPKCKEGKLIYAGDDWTGRVWISIYECDTCGEEYV